MTFWQRFLARPPLRAWAVGVVPAATLVIVVRMASTNHALRYFVAFIAIAVMHVVAAAVWPRLASGYRRPYVRVGPDE